MLLAASTIRGPALQAQAAPFTLAPGTRVQLLYRDTVRLQSIGVNRQRMTGVLLADTAGVYQLSLPGGGQATVRHDMVQRAWSSRGYSRWRSALGTGFAMAGAGNLIGFSVGGSSAARQNGAIGAAIGFGLGALLGTVRPFETWRGVRR